MAGPRQPMGVGVGGPRFIEKVQAETQAAQIQEQQAYIGATQLQAELLKSPTLKILAQEMEDTMLKAYVATPDGQAQIRFMKKLGMTLEPSFIAKNLRRKLMGPKLADLLKETQAAP